jgi:hypothetical protein
MFITVRSLKMETTPLMWVVPDIFKNLENEIAPDETVLRTLVPFTMSQMPILEFELFPAKLALYA